MGRQLNESKARRRGESALSGIFNRAHEVFAPAVTTGFDKLDKAVRMSPGRLIVLGARPGTGKTTFATQLACQILSGTEKGRILFCSVEMESAEIGLKAVSAMSGVNCITPFEIKDKEKIQNVYSIATELSGPLDRFHIYHGTRLDELIKLSHELFWEKDHPLLMVVVDFITSMQPLEEYPTRTEAIGSISRELKAMAKDLKVPVFCCAQLNRGTQPGKRPAMKDLRDSGNIEQDADVVLLLHNPADKEGVLSGRTELIIDKNRFGTMDILTLQPELHFHRFRER